jgi:hypothetical protein
MSGLFFWLTALVLPLPLLMLWIGLATGSGPLIWAPAAFVTVVYLFVWLYMRPTCFELSATSLDIVWPLRRLQVPLAAIARVELLSSADFRSRYGYGYRIGAGGLWGGFGLLKMKSVTFRFYISSMDGYVIVHCRSDRPLLITPADPQVFVAALGPAAARLS